MISINKRIPHQGHWINPTIMPFGGGVKISCSVHSNPKSVIMCWKHLLTTRIPRVSVKRQRSGESLEAKAIVSWVPCAASVRQSCYPLRPLPAWIHTASDLIAQTYRYAYFQSKTKRNYFRWFCGERRYLPKNSVVIQPWNCFCVTKFSMINNIKSL